MGSASSDLAHPSEGYKTSYLFVYHVSNTCRPPYPNPQCYLLKLEFLKLELKHLYLSSVQMYIFSYAA